MVNLALKTRHEIRNYIRRKRQSLGHSSQEFASQTVLARLKNSSNVIEAKNIAVYLANDGELNIQSFIDWCWQKGKNIYLPVIHPFSKGNLLFLQFTPTTIMHKNKYGINEPVLNVANIIPVNQLDIVFTPLVGFDNKGGRLGMGGGYYDRTLAQWFTTKSMLKPIPIGLAHDCQQVNAIPHEIWDIPLPEIITPSKHYIFDVK